ncbi:MAG: hypothetical protein IJ660_02960 [Alphaproteobacteria bacterium]|nr:hypothetical protein [Alphaproteobacteria bacterium]
MNNNFQSLKIGLDYHGVINNQPQYFKAFCDEAFRRGHRIYILTGGPKHRIIRKLKADKIRYTAIFAIIDYYRAKQQIACLSCGDFYIEKRLWNTAKSAFCYQHGLNIQIDDSNIYGRYFTTPYCQYEQTQQKCFLRTIKNCLEITLESPFQAIQNLEACYWSRATAIPAALKSATY